MYGGESEAPGHFSMNESNPMDAGGLIRPTVFDPSHVQCSDQAAGGYKEENARDRPTDWCLATNVLLAVFLPSPNASQP